MSSLPLTPTPTPTPTLTPNQERLLSHDVLQCLIALLVEPATATDPSLRVQALSTLAELLTLTLLLTPPLPLPFTPTPNPDPTPTPNPNPTPTPTPTPNPYPRRSARWPSLCVGTGSAARRSPPPRQRASRGIQSCVRRCARAY